MVRVLDLRLEIAGSVPAAALSSSTLDTLFTHIVQRLWRYNLMALYKSVYFKKIKKKISACDGNVTLTSFLSTLSSRLTNTHTSCLCWWMVIFSLFSCCCCALSAVAWFDNCDTNSVTNNLALKQLHLDGVGDYITVGAMCCCVLPGLYNITNSYGKVAEFCLFKQAYRIGDDVIGTCDFSSASIPCVQVICSV